jgi:hypothetical protein
MIWICKSRDADPDPYQKVTNLRHCLQLIIAVPSALLGPFAVMIHNPDPYSLTNFT